MVNSHWTWTTRAVGTVPPLNLVLFTWAIQVLQGVLAPRRPMVCLPKSETLVIQLWDISQMWKIKVVSPVQRRHYCADENQSLSDTPLLC